MFARRLVPLAMAAIVAFGIGAPAAAGATDARPAGSVSRAAVSAQPDSATAAPLEGIDVSHWQGPIDWTAVAAAGKAFTIIKATEGTTYVDPTYATNHAGAQAAGLWTGAYHFAKPDATANDAVLEADHFVSALGLGKSDLIPALDLEVSGGLGIAALQGWVASWLGEVTAKVGVRPMIYVSPAFWKKYMGDSEALADAGYKILWIAHWGVASPTIPARNWGGHGWTFWQYSDCGNVPGIAGCVDLDRYNGTDLLPQAYSIFSLAAAGAQVKQGHSSAAVVRIARTNFPSEVALDVSGLPAGTSASFDASPTTDSTAALTVATDPTRTPTGSYPLIVTGVGDGLTRTAHLTLVVADGLPPAVVAPYTGLRGGTTLGSSTVAVHVSWSASDPSGIASSTLQRSVWGGAWRGVALSARTAANEALALGTPTRQRARATDRLANTSAWLAGPLMRADLIQQTSPTVRYAGTWHTQRTWTASGGSLRYASSAGASATWTFTGSSVAWIAKRGPNRGWARVYVDGAYITTVKLTASVYSSKAVVFAKNWRSNAAHTLRIVVGPGGRRVDVDAFVRLSLT